VKYSLVLLVNFSSIVEESAVLLAPVAL